MPIKDVGVPDGSIPDIGIWVKPVRPGLLTPRLPHGVSMELPVVQYPGCVEAHVDSSLQSGLSSNDPSQVRIYCDAGMPSFNAMDYTASEPVKNKKFEPPKLGDMTKKVEAQNIPSQKLPGHNISTASTQELKQTKPSCAPGEYLRGGRCIRLVQEENKIAEIAEKYLPPLEAATTTATVAAIATVTALLAKPVTNFLLKLIKPMVKKIINKIKKAMGKQVRPRSVQERILAQRSRNQLLRQARDLMG